MDLEDGRSVTGGGEGRSYPVQEHQCEQRLGEGDGGP